MYSLASVLLLATAPSEVLAQSRTYTSTADFNEGTLINLDASSDELKLTSATQSFEFIWIAVSTKGTAVKIDTETGMILGEYRTAPQTFGSGSSLDPSRTTVDNNGSVWVTNRAISSFVAANAIAPGFPSVGRFMGSAVHIGLVENNECEDRNGNGTIETSTGQNDIRTWDAGLTGADNLGGVSTAQDECIIHYVRTNSTGTRHVSVTAGNDVWMSGTGGRYFDLFDGDTGAILRQEGPVGYGGYGGLIDASGVIWSASPMLRWDTALPLTGPNGGNWDGYSHDSYGLCIDSQGNVWNTALFGNQIRKFAPDGTLLATFGHGFNNAQGCVVDGNDHVWVAHSLLGGSTVGHILNDGTYVGNVPVGSGPTGVAVDAAGKIWATNYNSRTASRIDPTAGPIGADGVTRVGAVDFTTVDLGGNPYNYSDMTGSTLSGAPDNGTWTVIYNSGTPGAEWGTISWTADVPGDAVLGIRAASSTDGVTFGPDQNVTHGADLTVADGQYLRISVAFARSSGGDSPTLYDLTVSTVLASLACDSVVLDDFDTTDGSEFFDLTNTSTTTPADLDGCRAMTYNVFTARAARVFDLSGVSLAPSDTYRIGNAGVPDVDLVAASGFLPEPWGFGLVDGDVAPGDHVFSFLPDVVTSLIYLTENGVYLFMHENPALDGLYCGFYAGRIAGNSPEVCRVTAPDRSRSDVAAAFASELLALQASLSASASSASATLPSTYALSESVPNPSRGVAAISFALPEATEIRLAVYDALGREVAVLAEGRHEAGRHAVSFDAAGSGLPSGTYLYRLEAGDYVATRQLTVVR